MGAFMKIQIMSDLHLEFAPFHLEVVDADIVILAGDIQQSGIQGVGWAQDCFDVPVLYTPGNHEFYSMVLTMDEIREEMHRQCKGSNVQLLDCNHWELDGVRFLGTTLWTDLLNSPFGGVSCGVISSDAGYIKVSDHEGLNDRFAQSLFDENSKWLKSELEKPFIGKTVVITHHAPSGASMHAQYAQNPWNSCFITNMEHLMGDHVDLWIHGHTHSSFDYRLHGTRVVCNPRGYPDHFGEYENSEFNPSFVVEI